MGWFNTLTSGGNTLETELTNALNQANALAPKAQVVYSKQVEMNNILTDETNRLNGQKTKVDEAALNQQRIIYFNDNHRKKNAVYLKILISAAITLFIIFMLFAYGQRIIPESILYILMISSGVIGGIICISYYMTILSRDNYNFDELKLNHPSKEIKVDPDSKSNKKVVAFDYSMNYGCVGQDCCPDASSPVRWCDKQKKCLHNANGVNFDSICTVLP
jgi:hypothetical protein